MEYLRKNVREYRELEAPEPVEDKLEGNLGDFEKETCVMKPTDVKLKTPPKAAPAAAETSPEAKKRKADSSPPASSTRSASTRKGKRSGPG